MNFLTWYKDLHARSSPMGTLVRNPEPAHARALDMMQAEEIGSAHRTDLGKIQLALLNLVLMVLFLVAALTPLTSPVQSVCADDAAAAAATLDDTACLGLPGLTGGMVGIIAASQGGYLLNKGAGNPIERWTSEDRAHLSSIGNIPSSSTPATPPPTPASPRTKGQADGSRAPDAA